MFQSPRVPLPRYDPSRYRPLVALLGLLALFGSLAHATTPPATDAPSVILFERATLAAGQQPFAIAAADLNAEGHLDLVVSHPGADALSLHLGEGDGRFAAARSLPTLRFPRGIAVADVDADGFLDLAVAAGGAAAVAVHRGAGDGSFAAPTRVAVGARPFLLAAGDASGDGVADLAVALEGAGQVAVLTNDGRGAFAVAHLAAGRSPATVAFGDVDGDRRLDLAAAAWQSNDLAIWRGDGAGAFAPLQQYRVDGRGIYALWLDDVDGDGAADLTWTDVKKGAVLIRAGDGRGGFAPAIEIATGRGTRSAAFADLDGDGRADLAAANLADDAMTISRANAGGFGPPQAVAVGRQPRMVVAADLDGDRRPDLATANMGSGDVTVLLNRGLGPPPATPTARRAAPTPVALPDDLDEPSGLAVDAQGRLVVADRAHHRVARVDPRDGRIEHLAGTGAPGRGGDGDAAATPLDRPSDVAIDARGAVLVTDLGNHQVRRIAADGTLTTVAGSGAPGFGGDGGPARAAQLRSPTALAVAADGSLFVADSENFRVRRIDPDGTITTVLGTGEPGSSGDGGPGTAAQVGTVTGLALDAHGDLLVVDQSNRRLRRLSRAGIVTTIAGGEAEAADGEKAVDALRAPARAIADWQGNVVISDQDGHRLLRLAPDGRLSTVAGRGVAAYDGDGGPAPAAGLWRPFALALAADGSLLVADGGNDVIRRIDAAGTISTIAGTPHERPWTAHAAHRPVAPAAAPAPRRAPPPLRWEHVFFSGSDANAPAAVAVTPQGGIVVAGDFSTGADWLVLELTADGKPRGRFEVRSPAIELPQAIALAADGTRVAAGYAGGRGHDGRDYLVIASDRDGRERWRYAPRQPGDQFARGVAIDAQGNVYVAGESAGKWQVFSLTADGAPRWSRDAFDGAARGIAVGPDGALVVAGSDSERWRVRKLTADGALVWERTVEPGRPGPDAAAATAVRIDAAGNPVVAGLWTGDVRAARVEKLSPGGELIWEFIDAPGTDASAAKAVDIDAAGRVLVAGRAGTDWLLFGLAADGRLDWRLTHDGGGAPINSDDALAIAAVGADGFVAAGILHPEPARLPYLGSVQWRVARYASSPDPPGR